MTPTLQRFAQFLRASVDARDAAAALGVASTCIGLYLVYAPAPWLFFGGFCLWIVFRRIPQ